MPLTPSQIAAYAYKAGFRGADLQRAVAIALAESGGNPGAYNPESAAGTSPGRGSFGLWQIYSTAHPQYDRSKLNDPLYNARAAYQVFREAGGKFTPWSTWNNGSAANIGQTLRFSLPANLNPTATQRSVISTTPGQRATITTQAVNMATNPSRPDLAYAQFMPPSYITGGTGTSAAPTKKTLLTASPSDWFEAFKKTVSFDKVTFGFYAGGVLFVIIGFVLLAVAYANGPGKDLAKEAIPLALGTVDPVAGIAATAATSESSSKN